MRLLVKNGHVVTERTDATMDVLCADGVVMCMSPGINPADADQVVDVSGRIVVPGGVDPHVHLELPAGGTVSSDDFATGTRAAVFGGATTIIDYVAARPGETHCDALEARLASARDKACIDYGFHVVLRDVPEQGLPEMEQLVSRGITSFKMFMAYPGVMYADDAAIYRAMRQATRYGAMVCMHAENGIVIAELVREARARGDLSPIWHARTRPAMLEAEAVSRTLAIAEAADAPAYIVHLSTAGGLEHIRRAQARGTHAFAETCPQYLLLDESLYEAPGFEAAKYIMTPPVRSAGDRRALWSGLADGSIQTVATDHCPFRFADQKTLGVDDFTKIPNGAPGIESRMPLLYSEGVARGCISLRQFVELTSTNAARIFGMYPAKGTIAPGSDADLVIIDPERVERIGVNNPATHHMNVDYSAYEGMEVRGFPATVIVKGQVVCSNGEFYGQPGSGNFLARKQTGVLPVSAAGRA